MKKIEIGHTNISYKKENFFYQEKIKNNFNHKTDYKLLSKFDFVPKLIENNENYSKWIWIEGKHLDNPTHEDLKKLGVILKEIHKSNLNFTKCNIRKRIEEYRNIMKTKNIKIEIIEKLYRKINTILKNMDKNTPVHGDLWSSNILKTNENKIYLIDWEYSHMGDKHYELAYFIETYDLSEEDEKIFLDAYEDFDYYILEKHKLLVNYITVLWLYAQNELPFSPEKCLKKLESLTKKLSN